jgi:cardiolipin synthase
MQMSSFRLTIPTLFTLLRFVLIPFLLTSIYAHQWGMALAIFVGAAITDAIDGALARWLHQQTLLGACLDPLADKSLMLASYVALAQVGLSNSFVPWWFVYCISIKEIIMVIGALYICFIKKQRSVKPLFWGKLAMTLQTGYVGWLFLMLASTISLPTVTILLFWCMVISTVIAFLQYLAKGHRS